MPEISQYYKREKLIATAGNAVLGGDDIAAMTQGSEELSNLGKTITNVAVEYIEKRKKEKEELLQEKEQADYYDQLNTAKTLTNQKDYDFQKSLEGTNPNEWEEKISAHQADTSIVDNITNPRAKAEAGFWLTEHNLQERGRIESFRNDIAIKNLVKSNNINITNIHNRIVNAPDQTGYLLGIGEAAAIFGMQLKPDGDATKIDDYVYDPNFDNPTYDSPEVRRAALEGFLIAVKPERQQVLLARTKESIISKYDAIIDDGITKKKSTREIKDEAYKMIRDEAKNNPLITPSVEQALGNALDNRVSGKVAQEKDDKAAYDLKNAQDFSKKIPNHVLTKDEVKELYPDKEDSKKVDAWGEIINNSYRKEGVGADELKTETTADGHTMVIGILSDVSKGGKTKTESYKNLLLARYGGKTKDEDGNDIVVEPSISKKTFDWAMNKIENPLPVHVTTQLQATMDTVKTAIYNAENLFWYTGAEKARVEAASEKFNDEIQANISDGLLDWVDGQIASGKVPTPKEIYEMAGQLTPGALTIVREKQQEQMKQSGEPQTQEEFERKVAELKATDMKQAKEYYEKWVSKWR